MPCSTIKPPTTEIILGTRHELGAIDDPAAKDALKQTNDEAIARGIFGSPFIVVDGEPFWGMDRFDQIDRWLATGGW